LSTVGFIDFPQALLLAGGSFFLLEELLCFACLAEVAELAELGVEQELHIPLQSIDLLFLLLAPLLYTDLPGADVLLCLERVLLKFRIFMVFMTKPGSVTAGLLLPLATEVVVVSEEPSDHCRMSLSDLEGLKIRPLSSSMAAILDSLSETMKMLSETSLFMCVLS
jgi:hypothetical protein